MDTALKQRLLGIAVLIGLLGFCLMVLLHKPRNIQPGIAKIDMHPPVAQVPSAVSSTHATSASLLVSKENKPRRVESHPVAIHSSSKLSSAPSSHPVSPVKPVVAEKKKNIVPVTSTRLSHIKKREKQFAVQVGTFKLEANAKELIRQLQKKGFEAKIQSIKTAQGEMTRVVVGKAAERTEAEVLRQKLEKTMKLNGIIVSRDNG